MPQPNSHHMHEFQSAALQCSQRKISSINQCKNQTPITYKLIKLKSTTIIKNVFPRNRQLAISDFPEIQSKSDTLTRDETVVVEVKLNNIII